MLEQEKLSRNQLLKDLNITDDTLSLYEHELEMAPDPAGGGLGNFTKEDLESIKTFHKLRESGLTYSEIKLLTSFSEVLKNVDLEGSEGIKEIKSLLNLSPIYRLKQSLNLTRQELNLLKSKAQELEDTLKKEIELKGKTPQVKGKKAKELYQIIAQKDLELEELKKKLELTNEDSLELKEKLELMEDDISEMENEVEERYQEQITSLREQIEGLIEKKQKEWESYYTKTSEQHKTEILTLQKRHEQEILNLKRKIKEQIEEIAELRTIRNPLVGLFKIGAGQR